MDRTALVYGLLLSIPPGIVVLEFTVAVTGGTSPVTPIGLLVGGTAAALIFLVVALGASGEDPEDSVEFTG